MKPPYDLTPEIIKRITSISEKLGEAKAIYLSKPSPKLRKENKIKTIHSSLKIEGNTLSIDQVTGLLENKRVIGPQKDITEVLNAIKIYDNLHAYNPLSEKSFLKCHKDLMQGLMEDNGNYRKRGVGILKGIKLEHLAPPTENVPFLMKDLFTYLETDEIELIKSCVFHYELEFIHPFLDGNGRMGRIWQTLILREKYPLFEYLPLENLISNNQDAYYKALSDSDKAGDSNFFLAYMLEVMENSIDILLNSASRKLTETDRLEYFISLNKTTFTRKE
ncbi:MAG: Fic family protein, partial [Flavobacteriales bacterium]|nr:Fic family protein [Flavobacteriales bacterium]